jgi:hypothetical protein
MPPQAAVPIPQGAQLVPLDQSQGGAVPIPQGATLQPLDQQAQGQTQQPPGLVQRLGQALGIPTSKDEWKQAITPPTVGGIPTGAPGSGLAALINYGKTAYQGIKQGGQEAIEAGQNIGQGQSILPNLGKAASGLLHAEMQATPFVGPSMETAGKDIASGNYGGAAGGLMGVIGQVAAPYALEKGSAALNTLRAPLGDTVTQPRGTVPAEAATPQELQAYADQNNIPLSAAQATEHNLPRNLQSAGERSTVGGTAVKQQIKASQAAVTSHAQDLMDSFSPNTPDLSTAGSTIQKGVQTALDREMANSRQAYAAIDQQAGGVSVDLKPLKQTAQKILSDSSFVRKAGALDQKRAASILQDMNNLPDTGTFSQTQELRSALLDASRSPDLAISNRAQAWIKQLTGTTDAQMMSAAQSKPNLESSFRDANDHWQQLQEDFNNPRSPLAQILQEPDPSKVPQKLTQRGQIGGSPYNAQLLDKYGIDKGPVKWAITGDLLQKNFGLSGGKTLGGYSDPFLQSVFHPQELSALYKTGSIARSVGLNTNPSGTSAVMGAMQDIEKPVRSLAPKAAAAKATTSPAFNRRMMTPGQAPFKSPVPIFPIGGANSAGQSTTPSGQPDQDFWQDAAEEYRKRHGRL